MLGGSGGFCDFGCGLWCLVDVGGIVVILAVWAVSLVVGFGILVGLLFWFCFLFNWFLDLVVWLFWVLLFLGDLFAVGLFDLGGFWITAIVGWDRTVFSCFVVDLIS